MARQLGEQLGQRGPEIDERAGELPRSGDLQGPRDRPGGTAHLAARPLDQGAQRQPLHERGGHVPRFGGLDRAVHRGRRLAEVLGRGPGHEDAGAGEQRILDVEPRDALAGERDPRQPVGGPVRVIRRERQARHERPQALDEERVASLLGLLELREHEALGLGRAPPGR